MLSGFEPEAAMGGRGSAGAWRRSTENGGSLREQEVEQQLWRGCASLVGVEGRGVVVWFVGRRRLAKGSWSDAFRPVLNRGEGIFLCSRL